METTKPDFGCSDISPLEHIECYPNLINNQSYLMERLIREVNKKQEEIIINVLRQILKREPVIEDAKDLTKIYYEGEPMNYDLAFRGTKIGRVVFDMTPPKFTITFNPVDYSPL